MCHFVGIVIIQIWLTFYYQCCEKTCSCDCVKKNAYFFAFIDQLHTVINPLFIAAYIIIIQNPSNSLYCGRKFVSVCALD